MRRTRPCSPRRVLESGGVWQLPLPRRALRKLPTVCGDPLRWALGTRAVQWVAKGMCNGGRRKEADAAAQQAGAAETTVPLPALLPERH